MEVLDRKVEEEVRPQREMRSCYGRKWNDTEVMGTGRVRQGRVLGSEGLRVLEGTLRSLPDIEIDRRKSPPPSEIIDSVKFSGLRQTSPDSVKILRTPSNSPYSVKFSGLRQILRTPSNSPDSVKFSGLRQILRTPSNSSDSVKTPRLARVRGR